MHKVIRTSTKQSTSAELEHAMLSAGKLRMCKDRIEEAAMAVEGVFQPTMT